MDNATTREAQLVLQQQNVEAALSAQARSGGTVESLALGVAPRQTGRRAGYWDGEEHWVGYMRCGDEIGTDKPLAP